MKMDFCLSMYREICLSLQAFNVVTLEAYLQGKAEKPFVVLRHDVDRELKNALAMAELEQSLGIRSTYYFRYPRTFDPEVLSRISQLGHEVGYHYEALDKAKGNYSLAAEIFRQELEYFRHLFPVRTVCMHGNPLTPWNGRLIWGHKDFGVFEDYGLLGEAYLSLGDRLLYITDTGRNWNGNHNVKDSFLAQEKTVNIRNTRHFVQLLNEGKCHELYLNCHPERWGPGMRDWARAFGRDHGFNLVKAVLQRSGNKG